MNIESTKFFKINRIAKTFIIVVLACCILMNIVNTIRLFEFLSIKFQIFVISILVLFIVSLYFENYLTTLILIVFNILFWYYTLTERKDLSWYDNPINHYDSSLTSFANLFQPIFRLILYKTISPLSTINNLLIWTIIIPFRIYKFYQIKIK